MTLEEGTKKEAKRAIELINDEIDKVITDILNEPEYVWVGKQRLFFDTGFRLGFGLGLWHQKEAKNHDKPFAW